MKFRSTKLFAMLSCAVCTGFLVVYSVAKMTEQPSTNNNLSARMKEPATKGREARHGYMVSLEYNGQQGAGVRALVSLQCFIGRFELPLYILEPVLTSTQFISNGLVHSNSVKFSQLFNMEHFNTVSAQLRFGTVAPQEDFLRHASRKVVYIEFIFGDDDQEEQEVIWLQKVCYTNEAIYNNLSMLFQGDFCIVGFIKTPIPQTNQVFNTVFESWKSEEITLVVSKWSGAWSVQSEYTQRTNHICTFENLRSIRKHLIPSTQLINDAKRYKKEVLKSDNLKTVAVMFRIEHLIQRISKCHLESPLAVKLCTNACFNDAIWKVTEKLHEVGFSTTPFVTIDIGEQGSATFEERLQDSGLTMDYVWNRAEWIISKLYNNTLSFEKWEASFAAITSHPGYMAALQRTVASEADCLVLVGGGNFQEITLHDFKHNAGASKDCYQLVCPELRMEQVADSL